ncbi:MAG: sugar transferase [Chloroflexi bacterium]|nr:sugar transferase [Chloroflexota bacterium]
MQADGTLSTEPLAGEPLAYTGIYLVEPEVAAHIPSRQPYTFAADLIPALLAKGLPVYGFKLTGYWNPLQTFTDYQAAQIFYLDSATQWNGHSNGHIPAGDGVTTYRYPTLDSHRMGQGVWVGKQAIIHPNARLRPPVLIGDNCRIGRDVELGPYAIIGSGVVVDDEATVENSVVLDRTYVGQLVKVTGRVVHKQTMIDPVSAESTTVTDQFLLGESSLETVGLDMRRLVDIAAALLLILLLWPILLVGMGVALLTRGRAFATTAVVGGRAGQPYSFARYEWAVRPRSWLTRLGWHRLPELFNLLRGDISLVGIQPLAAAEATALTESWQTQRYKQPAGLTGLWYTQSATTPEEHLMADTYYAATRTWRKDLHILWQTPGVWVRRVVRGGV